MSTFDLRGLVRDTLARSREADPHVIARRLVARIPAEHVHAALAECLADRVRIELGRQRMHSGQAGGSPGPVPRQSRSWRAAYKDLCAQRHAVPGVGWKRLGDCTAEDCDAIAEGYARRAAEQHALEQRFREYALMLREARAATLADLGAEAVAA